MADQTISPIAPVGGTSANGSSATGSSAFGNALSRLPALLQIGAILAALGFFVFLIQPWRLPTAEPEQNMSVLWSDSIRKLGIEPIFPPAEDFQVGDIWAVIATLEDQDGQTREVSPDKSILGKGVRIGHIPPTALGYSEAEKLRFPETASADGNVQYGETRQKTSAEAATGVNLTYVSFPNIDVSGTTAHKGTFLSNWLFTASRDKSQTEVVKIPVAETYSVPVPNAIVALGSWCVTRGKGLGLCTDETIRKIVSYSLQNKVFDRVNGKYGYRFEVKLVTQTFLARQIEFQRGYQNGVTVNVKSKPDAQTVPAPSAENAGQDRATADELNSTDSVNSTFGLDKVIYPRPVVFGFRAVSISIPTEPASDPAAVKQ